MVFERYTLETEKFHCLKIKDNIKNQEYACLDRFEEKPLQRFCDDLNNENQASQDYQDNVHDWFIENWGNLSDEQKQSAHLELGIEIDYRG